MSVRAFYADWAGYNRRTIEGRTAREITSDHTTFGLGVTSVDFTFAGATFDRLFYERK